MIIRTMRSTIRPDIGLQSLAQRRGRVASKLKMVCTDNAEYLEITRYRLCGRIRRQYIRYFREQCAHFGGLNLIHCVPDAVHFEVSVAQGYGLLAKVSFSEHRVIPPVVEASSETAATHAGGTISVATLRADLDTASNDAEEDYRLVAGDRVVIRYLDAEPSRPEFFAMSDIADDPMNGYLLLSSPLGQALSDGSPGDELSFQAGARERSVLFVSLEALSAQAA